MSVSYNIGSLSAQLRVCAIHARHGGVIHADLVWTLTRDTTQPAPHISYHPSYSLETTSQASSSPGHYTSKAAQPVFEVLPGNYTLHVKHGTLEATVENLQLTQNTLTEYAVLLEAGQRDDEADYFVSDEELDPVTEHSRRQLEREAQRQFGSANGPLKDPYAKTGEGELLSTHPLLQVAQFSGDSNMLPTPENPVAREKTHELQRQLNAQPVANPHAGLKR